MTKSRERDDGLDRGLGATSAPGEVAPRTNPHETFVVIAGPERIHLSFHEAGVTITHAPFWHERLTEDETRRLAEALLGGLERQ